MVAEVIIACSVLIPALVGLWRDVRGAKKVSRAQLISEGEKVAWGIVEATKAAAKTKGKPLTNEDMGKLFKEQVYQFILNKGLKGFTLHEAEALHKSAAMLSQAAKGRKVVA